MILDNLSIPGELVRFGWPWHGMLQRPSGVTAPRDRLAMESRTLLTRMSGDIDEHPWLFFVHSPDTLLWAPGLPDIDDPDVEGQGGKWLGKAILRGSLERNSLVAYGSTFINRTTAYAGDICVWPIWLDGKKGRASLRLNDGAYSVHLFLDDTIGTPTPELALALTPIDWEQESPDVYDHGVLATRVFLGAALDMTPDGRSILLPVYSAAPAGTPGPTVTYGQHLTGLIRLDISGDGGEFAGAFSLVMGRAAAVGELVNKPDPEFPIASWYTPPMQITPMGEWPSCSDSIARRYGEIVPIPEGETSTSPYRGYDGDASKTVSRKGVLWNAWFGADGTPEVIRYNVELTRSVSNHREDISSGMYESITRYQSGPSSCEFVDETTTDTLSIGIRGTTTTSALFKLSLYGPDGLLVDEVSQEIRSQTDVEFSADTGFNEAGTSTEQHFVNGTLLKEQTSTSLPVGGWGLGPAALKPFGALIVQGDMRRDVTSRILGVNNQTLSLTGEVGVMRASNKADCLAWWTLDYTGPTTKAVIGNHGYATPSGWQPSAVSSEIDWASGDSAPFGLLNTAASRFVEASHNPVTHALARAWPDYITVSWV